MIVAARRAGISKWALPLLAYPLISVAIVVAAGEDLDPWGMSWLWVLAVLGPVVGAATLLKQDESRDSPRRSRRRFVRPGDFLSLPCPAGCRISTLTQHSGGIFARRLALPALLSRS